ncbi:MAG: class I SAM-dependent methyltransferase [Pyrinomonadaceae bacterium]|jgi:SAM-dependent methyltransferase|nr:class I SAM-dependent methyltransferase [Pyrinomonadaceae bacterium]
MNYTKEFLKYVEWDVRNWSVALEFWQMHTKKKIAESKVLEIGANFGGLSLWFASKGASVVSTDFKGVREEAVRLHKSSEFSHLIRHETVNALEIPYTEEFDIVVFKSVIGVFDDINLQKKSIREMHKALKKGGELFFAENLVASPLHNFMRRKMVKWGTSWRYITIDEMDEFLEPFADKCLQTNGFAGTFGRTEFQRNLFALGDQMIFEHIIPPKWKYIIAGVASK